MFRNQHLRAAAWDVNAIDPTYSAAAIGIFPFSFRGVLAWRQLRDPLRSTLLLAADALSSTMEAGPLLSG